MMSFFIRDQPHPATQAFPPGRLGLLGPMWMDAQQPAGNGLVLAGAFNNDF